MAFNQIGVGTIAPGGAFTWGVNFGPGSDRGAQYVAADGFFSFGGSVMTDQQTKQRDQAGTSFYWATFHNLHPTETCRFSMQGGGFA
jgi:hypothetical protein